MAILRGERIILRPWRAGDEEALAKHANNRKVWRNLRDRFPHPYTLADAKVWIEVASKVSPIHNFTLELEGSAVGGIGLILGVDIFRFGAELGYWLGEPFWGQGLMVEAVRLVTEYGFRELGLKRIHAGAFAWNPASARVLEKAGFVLESRMKKAVFKDGQFVDQLMYAKLDA